MTDLVRTAHPYYLMHAVIMTVGRLTSRLAGRVSQRRENLLSTTNQHMRSSPVNDLSSVL